jgi:hypothetical protein
MPDKPKTKKSTGWSAARKHISTWEKPALLALVKDLYDSAPGNRNFIHARCQAEDCSGEVLESYRKKIVHQFYPTRGSGKLKLGEARKAIREYKKATGNTAGVIELLLTYLENGNDFTCEFGDIDERFYDSLCSVMNELAALLTVEGAPAYASVRDRLQQIATDCTGIGWGYSDHITGSVAALEDALGSDDIT